ASNDKSDHAVGDFSGGPEIAFSGTRNRSAHRRVGVERPCQGDQASGPARMSIARAQTTNSIARWRMQRRPYRKKLCIRSLQTCLSLVESNLQETAQAVLSGVSSLSRLKACAPFFLAWIAVLIRTRGEPLRINWPEARA